MLAFLENLCSLCLLFLQSYGNQAHLITLQSEKASKVEIFGQIGLLPSSPSRSDGENIQVNISEVHFERMLTIITISKSVYVELGGKYHTSIEFIMDACLALGWYEDCLMLAKMRPDLTHKLLFVIFDRLFKIVVESNSCVISDFPRPILLGEVRRVRPAARLGHTSLQIR